MKNGNSHVRTDFNFQKLIKFPLGFIHEKGIHTAIIIIASKHTSQNGIENYCNLLDNEGNKLIYIPLSNGVEFAALQASVNPQPI